MCSMRPMAPASFSSSAPSGRPSNPARPAQPRPAAPASPVDIIEIDPRLIEECLERDVAQSTELATQVRANRCAAPTQTFRRTSSAATRSSFDVAARPGGSGNPCSHLPDEATAASAGESSIPEVEPELCVLAADEVEHRQAGLVVGDDAGRARAVAGRRSRFRLDAGIARCLWPEMSTPSLKRSTVNSALTAPDSRSRLGGRRAPDGPRRSGGHCPTRDARRYEPLGHEHSAWAMLTQKPTARMSADVGDLVAYGLQHQPVLVRRCLCRRCLGRRRRILPRGLGANAAPRPSRLT